MKSILRFYAAGMITAAIALSNTPHMIPADEATPRVVNSMMVNLVATAILWPVPVVVSFVGFSYER